MRRSTLVLPLLVALVVSACAGAAAPGAQFGDDSALEPAGAPVPAPTAAPADGGTNRTAIRDDAKIVRSGSLALQVDDLQAALARGREAVDALGGYVGASRETNTDDQPSAQITYRIPVDRWDEALAALRGHARKVVEESTDAVEVTDQLVDLAARIRNLRASEDALIAIAARAEKISDVLEVQTRLTEVRGEIERLEAQRVSLDDRAAFATLTVTYGLQVAAVKEAAKGYDPAAEVDRASAELIGILQGLATAGIWFAIVWLPILVVLLVLAFVFARIARRMGLRFPSRASSGWVPPTPPPPPAAPSGS